MSNPLVSVVIPTYNSSRYLQEAIESVLAQTYMPVEVLVVNDGSTDDTAEVLASYGPRIVAIHQANAGTAAARNTGVATSKGAYIAFLDHDDMWRPEKLAKQMVLFDAESPPGMVYCGREFYNDATGVVTSRHPADPEMDFHDFLALNAIALQSAVIPKSIMDEVGVFDTSISGADDWEMCLRIASKHSVNGVPDILVEIRGHEGQQGTHAESMYVKIMSVFERYEHTHGNCSKCKLAAATGRRALREGFYQRMLTTAKSAFRAHRPAHGAAVLLRAIKENPVALTRLPRRIVQRFSLRPRRSGG